MSARVEPAELSERLGTVTVIDVRSPAEFASAHIPGSFNLPLDQFPECVPDIESAVASPVVLVCRSGQRAQEAERVLQGSDLCGLQVLEGGLGAWENTGLPLTRGKPRWSMERQVRGVAGALMLAGLIGSLKFRPLALLSAGVAGGLLYSALSDTCTMAKVLSKLPCNQGAGCDVSEVLREIAARQDVSAAAAD